MFTHVVNTTSVAFIREVTVKSFSPHKSISNPGFHLLSLVPPYAVDEPLADSEPYTFTDSPCFLPSQSAIYTSVYLPLTILTFLILFILNPLKSRARYQALLPSVVKQTQSSAPRAVTYLSQYEKGSTSLLSSPESQYSSPSLSPRHSDDSPLPTRYNISSRSRPRHLKNKPSSHWKEAKDASRWKSIFRPRRLWQAFRGALLGFFLVVSPSLVLWTLLTWWTLR